LEIEKKIHFPDLFSWIYDPKTFNYLSIFRFNKSIESWIY